MNALVGLGWTCWIAAAMWSRRPLEQRPDLAVALAPAAGGGAGADGPLVRWGEAAQRRMPVLAELSAAAVGAALAIVALMVVLAPQSGIALGVGVVTLARIRSVGRQREHRRRCSAQAPAVVDLIRLCLDAGMSPRLAMARVAASIDPPLRDDLGRIAVRTDRGEALVAALEPLTERGHPLRSLALALSSAERTGVPLVGSLDRLATEARSAQRRATEERARRLPVLMLLPLVTCVLPAFGLIALAPLLIRGLAGFA